MKKYIPILFIAIAFTACVEDPIIPPAPGEEEELITTVWMTFTDSATSEKYSIKFRDLDGEGGNEPQIDTVLLSAKRTYFVDIVLLDESKNPVDSVSNEIKEEANDHQFFYYVTDASVNIFYLDSDSNSPPLPLGLKTKWETGFDTSHGQLRLVLKHQPGIKNGTDIPGETDIEITFPLHIHP